ncbi:MAG: hypothetical protein HUJ26_21055 [Planctomycetaceae bacterium]|nr:hypothetical protein [Planctomycetaceae bacterium]
MEAHNTDVPTDPGQPASPAEPSPTNSRRWSQPPSYIPYVGIVTLCLLLFLTLPSPSPNSHQAHAAPPVVRKNTQPFDRNWLETFWMLRQKCNGCHRPGTDQHDFSSYQTLMGDGPSGKLIVPGHPEQSLLWEYVNWNHSESPDSNAPDVPMMPPEDSHQERLTQGQLETLYRWIASGALDYELPKTCDTRPLLETDFVSAKECAHCHPKQYSEWSRSMHAYAQHSPVMEAFTLTLIERTGGTIGTFCTRCHTPIGVSIGESASMRNIHRSRISMEGVTCVVCHRLQKPFYKASGRIPVTPGQITDGCFYGPFNHAANPDGSSHASTKGDHLAKASFCGSCHDVTSPQGIRLEEAFSEWQNSPAARQGITCHDCHMGPTPGVPVKRHQRPLGKAATVPGVDPDRLPDRRLSNHSFVGPDYSLLPDTEFPEKLDWMYETDYRQQHQLTDYQRNTLTQLRVENRMQLAKAKQLRLQLLKNAAKIDVLHPEVVGPGDKLKINVDVTSLTAGHNFPTGFSAERQAWVEIRVTDAAGHLLFVSGDLDRNGDLRDAHSHAVERGELPYDKHLLNFQSKFVALTAQGTERSVILSVNRDLSPLNVIRPTDQAAQSFGRPSGFRVSKASIPPLATVSQKYPVRVPDCEGPCHVQVRLNFRNLPPVLFDKIGIPHLKSQLETVVIDEYHGTIQVHNRPSSSGRGLKSLFRGFKD